MRGKLLLILITKVVLLFITSESEAHLLIPEQLEEYYDLEDKLVDIFQKYLEQQHSILELVKERQEQHDKIKDIQLSEEDYINNPLNAHALLKRLVAEWPLTLTLLSSGRPVVEDEDELPEWSEFQTIIHSITWLQQVYNINISEIVSGTAFQNTDKTSAFTAGDCITVGKYLYESQQPTAAVQWFKQALSMLGSVEGGARASVATQDQQPLSPPPEHLLEYLALASCFMGDQRESSYFFQQLYTTYPSYHPAHDLLADHQKTISESCAELGKNHSQRFNTNLIFNNMTLEDDETLAYYSNALCHGRSWNGNSRALRCHLAHYQRPPLRLAPVKLEELHLEPPVVRIHDAIHPSEIQHFLSSVQPKPRYKQVRGWWGWLEADGVGGRLLRRVSAMTRLTPRPSQPVLFSSYGENSLHSPRFDSDVKQDFETQFGDRTASMVFYLDTPRGGGDMVFPNLGLSVAPVKGSALLWYNLHRDGEPDSRAIHGTCHTQRGTMRTLTMWPGMSAAPFESQCSANKGAKWKYL